MINFLLAMFGFDRGLSVGIAPQATVTERHGFATVRHITGGDTFVQPIVVDKPEMLISPSWMLIESIYEQLFKMGFEPVNLEIENPFERRVYKYGRARPILVEPI